MFNYHIYIRFNDRTEQIGAQTYLMAWEAYRMAANIYPNAACIDLIDAHTGEVFQSNDPNF